MALERFGIFTLAFLGATIFVPALEVGAQRVTAATCSEFGAIERGGRCIYPALADCRRKPSTPSLAANFECPMNTTCEQNTGLCVCVGEYRSTGDRDNILTCIRGRVFGQRCNLEDPCLSPFTCSRTGTCDCPSPSIWNPAESRCYNDQDCSRRRSGMFYEAESQQCKCLLDHRDCRRQASDCPANSGVRTELTPRLTSIFFCVCNSGFVQTDDKHRCVKPKLYGEFCNSANGELCDESLRLTCENRTCACDPYDKMYDPSRKSCAYKVGGPCQVDVYTLALGRLEQAQCGLHTVCRRVAGSDATQCACADGYSPTSSGRCAGLYGKACQISEDCSDGFDCMEGVCDCRNRVNQVYDRASSRTAPCKIRIQSRCTTNDSCVSHSHCNARRVCECDEEYTDDSQRLGRCKAAFSHGSPCTANQCDTDKGYACRSGKCECADSALVFRGKEQGCLGTAGSKCGTVEFDKVTYKISCERPTTCQKSTGMTDTAAGVEHNLCR